MIPPKRPTRPRGSVCDALVECIDFAPTFVEAAGAEPDLHILEGESLIPILHGKSDETLRDFVICEYDYSASPVADKLGADVRDATMFMVANKEWKLMHFEGGHRPMLFDLANDPDELNDLGESDEHADVIAEMYDKLFTWARRPSQRTTRSAAQLVEMRTKSRGRGIVLGVYDENDVPLDLTVRYRGRKAPDMKNGPKS